jgi:rfaE bifunctional protein nucleotidyltransferase chain/domain
MGIVIKDLKILRDFVNEDRINGKRIVFANGCFEILHVGHIRFFKEAKALGHILIIATNSDKTLLELGKRKEIIVPEDERLEVLTAIKYIDYVTIMNELTADKLLSELRPDINVKGPDYTQDDVLEKETIKSYGGKTIIVCKDKKHSTSDIFMKIRKSDINFDFICPKKRMENI